MNVIMIYYKSAQLWICESHWDYRSFRAYTGVQVESKHWEPAPTTHPKRLRRTSKTKRTAWTMARARKSRWISPSPYSERFSLPTTTQANKHLKMWKWTWKYPNFIPTNHHFQKQNLFKKWISYAGSFQMGILIHRVLESNPTTKSFAYVC